MRAYIKPALSRDDSKLRSYDYERISNMARDGALMRRFDLIEVPELSFERAKNVLSKVALQLNNGIEVPETVQDRVWHYHNAISLTVTSWKGNYVVRWCVKCRTTDNKLSNQDVATIIHDDYHVPEYVINQTTDERLLNLLPRLKAVIGQDTALEKLRETD